jgi:hypothetical protein
MPSAKTVAQKPAGKLNPLSSLVHNGFLLLASALDPLCADAIELTKQNAATTTIHGNRFTATRSNRIEPPGNRLQKMLLVILLHLSLSHLKADTRRHRPMSKMSSTWESCRNVE